MLRAILKQKNEGNEKFRTCVKKLSVWNFFDDIRTQRKVLGYVFIPKIQHVTNPYSNMSVVEVGSIKPSTVPKKCRVFALRECIPILEKLLQEKREQRCMFYVYCYMAALVICILPPSKVIINPATRYWYFVQKSFKKMYWYRSAHTNNVSKPTNTVLPWWKVENIYFSTYVKSVPLLNSHGKQTCKGLGQNNAQCQSWSRGTKKYYAMRILIPHCNTYYWKLCILEAFLTKNLHLHPEQQYDTYPYSTVRYVHYLYIRPVKDKQPCFWHKNSF